MVNNHSITRKYELEPERLSDKRSIHTERTYVEAVFLYSLSFIIDLTRFLYGYRT